MRGLFLASLTFLLKASLTLLLCTACGVKLPPVAPEPEKVAPPPPFLDCSPTDPECDKTDPNYQPVKKR